MSGSIDFYGPLLKVERANHHIAHLKDIFGKYTRDHKKRLRLKHYGDVGHTASLGFSLPKHTPTVLGDAIHNLRAALDHSYCILVEANGDTIHPRSFFPFVPDKPHVTAERSLQDTKGSINGHVKAGHAPSQAVIDCIFDVIQPYRGGNGDDLHGLHNLDVADKHLVLLPTRMVAAVDHLRMSNGIPSEDIILSGFSVVSDEGHGTSLIFPPGHRLQEDQNFKTAFDIVFQQGQPFEGKSILTTLQNLEVRVRETLATLKGVAESAGLSSHA